MKGSKPISMAFMLCLVVTLFAGGVYAAEESTEPDIIIPSSGKEIILQPISHVSPEELFAPVDTASEKQGRGA